LRQRRCATAIVDAALEGGINLIDTADFYSRGESEEMVGKAIAVWSVCISPDYANRKSR
jgi:aryl-alcohol dehydrogenase-like predicted oxidoreductase